MYPGKHKIKFLKHLCPHYKLKRKLQNYWKLGFQVMMTISTLDPPMERLEPKKPVDCRFCEAKKLRLSGL